jgi:NADP-dependent 3-hydroxy acid dehydrogenase YdfG
MPFGPTKRLIGELKKEETNMNSLKDVAVATDAAHVILGASGNTGSIIANSLLSEGKKVRVVGRDAGRLRALCAKARKRLRPR